MGDSLTGWGQHGEGYTQREERRALENRLQREIVLSAGTNQVRVGTSLGRVRNASNHRNVTTKWQERAAQLPGW